MNMENKNILLLRHHPMNVHFTNTFYTSQTEHDLGEYMIFDVTSRVTRNKEFMEQHPRFARELSPFYVGPVTSADGVKAEIFEIFWQCGKVYPCHDDNGKPNADYFEWRNYFYSQTECTKDLMRHTCKSIGYDHKDARYFAYFDKDKGDYTPLGYVEARKKVYFPEYAKLIYNTESFRYLKSLVDSGKKIALVDFDACNYNEACAMQKEHTAYVNKCKKNKTAPALTEADFLNITSLTELINAPFMKVGHGCVIKALLQGDIEVVDGEVVDRAGILA
jgi:hypothetical protein